MHFVDRFHEPLIRPLLQAVHADIVAVYLHHVECLFADTTGSCLQIDDR